MSIMKAKLNTNLLPIINIGTYNSELSPEFMWDDYLINDDFADGLIPYDSEYFWEKFDNEKYMNELEQCAKNFISEINFSEIIPGLKISAGDIYSPKYYNYSTDNIDLHVKFLKNTVLKLVTRDRENFDKFLHKNYSSYSGFISFTANNFEEWQEEYKKGEDQEIAAALTYLLKDYIEEWSEGFYDYARDYFMGNSCMSEFADLDLIYEEAEKFEKLCRENYLTLKPEKFAKEIFESCEFSDLSEIYMRRKARDIKAEIDKNTGNLFADMENCMN